MEKPPPHRDMCDPAPPAKAVDGEVRDASPARTAKGPGRDDTPGGTGAAAAKLLATKSTSLRKLQFGEEPPRAELDHRVLLLNGIKLFQALGRPEVESAARAMEKGDFERGDVLIEQGEAGDACYIVDRGVADVWVDGAKVHAYGERGFFGEWALLRHEVRAATVTAGSDDLSVYRLDKDDFGAIIEERDHLEDLIRDQKFFENFDDEKVAKIAAACAHAAYADGEEIVTQGAAGTCCFLLDSGECVAKISTGSDVQIVKRYTSGDLFGEVALLKRSVRAASIEAVGSVAVYTLSLYDFERLFGGTSLRAFHAEHYPMDPRKLISDFYRDGDASGPAGAGAGERAGGEATRWFAIFRPCSRDSIAKMLGKVGVGKGLNVKGKSAKKNRLSGFVPFVQIHKDAHKDKVEEPPHWSRFRVYYKSELQRTEARAGLEALKKFWFAWCKRGVGEILDLNDYADMYGLDVPEFLFMDAYVKRADVRPMVGWETGRDSEPAFMNMNLHTLRGTSSPTVVLLQHDTLEAMNPRGLLVARGAGHGRERREAPISAVSRSFRLIFGRAVIPWNGLDAWTRFPERARANRSR